MANNTFRNDSSISFDCNVEGSFVDPFPVVHDTEPLAMETPSSSVAPDGLEPRPIGPLATFSKKSSSTACHDVPLKKPKRALNVYNFYFFHHRQAILESRGKTGGFKALAAMIAERWAKATKEEKEPFRRMAVQDKKRYIHEMNEWKKNKAILESSPQAYYLSTACAQHAEAEAYQRLLQSLQLTEIDAFIRAFK